MKKYILYGTFCIAAIGLGICIGEIKIKRLQKQVQEHDQTKQKLQKEITLLKEQIRRELTSLWEGDDIK